MARKQYRGVMVFDFEVDGKFSTVAQLEEAWDQFCEDMQTAVTATVSDVKIEQAQAELQDRRGKTGAIKNIVFRGGRGTNEKMSKSQAQRLEELWMKRWTLQNMEYTDLKGEEKKLYNKLMHMADKEGLIIDENHGRLRNAKSGAMLYKDGKVNHQWRFQKKAWELAGQYDYDASVDDNHADISRRLINGEIEGIEQAIFFWEMKASDHMPPKLAETYKEVLKSKSGPMGAIMGDPNLGKLISTLPTTEALTNLNKILAEKDRLDRAKADLDAKTVKLPIGTIRFRKGSKDVPLKWTGGRKGFAQKLAKMTNEERTNLIERALDRIKRNKSAEWGAETVVKASKALKEAKADPSEDKFDEIWKTMDFETMQGQKAN